MSKAPAVDYALEIIEFFSKAHGEIGIADISNTLDINKNAVSRILEALTEKNWIYLSNDSLKKYSLTLRPFSLIARHTNNQKITKLAAPCLEQLNKKLGDSVYLGVKNGNNVLYLLHYDSTKEVRISGRTGGEYPLHCSAPGKVLLAHESPTEIDAYFSAVPEKRTANTIQTAVEFYEECKKIKKLGYAVDNEEFGKGILCVACPIYDHDGRVIAVIGLSTLTIYDDLDSLLSSKYPLLKKAADQISECLGFMKL